MSKKIYNTSSLTFSFFYVCIQDELLALIEMGSALTFVISISYEIKESLEQTFLSPLLEVYDLALFLFLLLLLVLFFTIKVSF